MEALASVSLDAMAPHLNQCPTHNSKELTSVTACSEQSPVRPGATHPPPRSACSRRALGKADRPPERGLHWHLQRCCGVLNSWVETPPLVKVRYVAQNPAWEVMVPTRPGDQTAPPWLVIHKHRSPPPSCWRHRAKRRASGARR
eukprot:15447086-Alexandrium_andersonii.AAC.2